MATLARDIMTRDPVCCTLNTSLDDVARMMSRNDCGEIPVIDTRDRIVGVITDRDIVCRIVAENHNPVGYTAALCMSSPVVTVREDDSLDEVVRVMEEHRIRRVPVVNDDDVCSGIIAQADVARTAPKREIATLVREVSKPGIEIAL